MKVELNTKEKVLLGLTLALAPIFVCEVYGVKVMRETEAFRTNPAMPQLADLGIGFAIAIAFVAVHYVLVRVFEPIGRLVLAPTKRTQERVERFATVLFKFIYFLGISYVGYAIMKEEKWLPRTLGGSGDVLESYKTLDTPPSQALKNYYFVQLGYHTHSLLYMVFLMPIRNDFLEMFLHHVATIFLIGSSYLANYTAKGALVAFLHDLGDISGYAIKSVVDTGITPLVVVMYVMLLVMWAYTRLYVLPVELIYNAIASVPKVNPGVSMLFLQPVNAMLCMLQILHVYWYALFLVMGYTLLKTGKQEDIQQKIRSKAETTTTKKAN